MASSGVAFWDSLLGVFLTVDVGPGLHRPDPDASTIAVKADGGTITVSTAGIKVDPVAVGVINPTPTTVPLRDTGGQLRAVEFIAGASKLMADPPVGNGAIAGTPTGPRWIEGDVGYYYAARRPRLFVIDNDTHNAQDGDQITLNGNADVVLPSAVDAAAMGEAPRIYLDAVAGSNSVTTSGAETISTLGAGTIAVPAGEFWELIGTSGGTWRLIVAT